METPLIDVKIEMVPGYDKQSINAHCLVCDQFAYNAVDGIALFPTSVIYGLYHVAQVGLLKRYYNSHRESSISERLLAYIVKTTLPPYHELNYFLEKRPVNAFTYSINDSACNLVK